MMESVWVCGAVFFFFLHRGVLWYEPAWVLSCVPILNTVTTLAKHVHKEWMEETKMTCSCVFLFQIFNFEKRTKTWGGNSGKTEKKSFCSFLDNTIMSNIQLKFCNICMYVWKFCKFVIVCTFWHMSVCIFKFELLVFGFVLHVDCCFSLFCLKVLLFSVYFWDHVQYCITWAGSWTSCYIDIIYEYKKMFSLWRKF